VTYIACGATATPVFEINVQGVVVHPRRWAPTSSGCGDSTIVNVTKTLGSSTSAYPIATSASDSGVPHRGQYVVIRSSWNSRPWPWSCLSDHHTLSM
jgi:hypothetical protein